MKRIRDLKHAYLIPFARVREAFHLDDLAADSGLSEEQFRGLIRMILRGISVDERWYRAQNPDVEEAILQGAFRSAKHHFVENGYFEGRRPFRTAVDEDWYGRAYPDVKEAIELGEIASFQEHFELFGEAEGRFPYED